MLCAQLDLQAHYGPNVRGYGEDCSYVLRGVVLLTRIGPGSSMVPHVPPLCLRIVVHHDHDLRFFSISATKGSSPQIEKNLRWSAVCSWGGIIAADHTALCPPPNLPLGKLCPHNPQIPRPADMAWRSDRDPLFRRLFIVPVPAHIGPAGVRIDDGRHRERSRGQGGAEGMQYSSNSL